jgi:YD repeat-containing protein
MFTHKEPLARLPADSRRTALLNNRLRAATFLMVLCASGAVRADAGYMFYVSEWENIGQADEHCNTYFAQIAASPSQSDNYVFEGCTLSTWDDGHGWTDRPAIVGKAEWDSAYYGHVTGYSVDYWKTGCPSSTVWNATTHRCEDSGFNLDKNIGAQQCTVPQQNCLKGNPINVAVGNKYQVEIDFDAAPLMAFRRYYNSFASGRINHLGPQWSHTYARSVQYLNQGMANSAVVISRAEGSSVTFRSVNGQWQADSDVVGSLVQHNDGQGQLLGWTYSPADAREVEEYDALGRLLQIARSDGNIVVLTYNNGTIQNSANDYLLTKVQAQSGRSLSFQYDTSLRLTTIADPTGAVYCYGYDPAGRLASVTYPGGSIRSYQYNEADHTEGGTFLNALTGISVDDIRFATFNYQVNGQAISTEHAGAAEKFATQYNGDGSSVTTTPIGSTQLRTFTTVLGVKKPTAVVETCTDCGPP